jgi:hypothetical protein
MLRAGLSPFTFHLSPIPQPFTSHQSLLTSHSRAASGRAVRFPDLFLAFSPAASRFAFCISSSYSSSFSSSNGTRRSFILCIPQLGEGKDEPAHVTAEPDSLGSMPIHNNEHGSFCVCYVVLPCSWPNLLSHFKISHGRKFEGELEKCS